MFRNLNWIFLIVCIFPDFLSARSVYLNGQDVSSAYGEQLKGVDIFIDQNGDIYISAPQYQIIMESTKNPLSLLETKKMHESKKYLPEQIHEQLRRKGGAAMKDGGSNPNHPGKTMVPGSEPASEDIPTVREK